MSAPMLGDIGAVASALAAIALNSLWEGALLVVCVWLLLRAWPRLNAATRYTVWTATLIATVVVPVATTLPFIAKPAASAPASAAMPAASGAQVTHANALSASTRQPVHAAALPAQSATPQTAAAAPQAAVFPALRVPERLRFALPLQLAIAIVVLWAGLAALALVRLGLGLRSLERLKHDALPLPVEYRDAMARWTAANKGSREVRLCVSDAIDVPVAVGLFDSMILIPRALLERLSENEVDQISLHELAHLRRADDWTNGLQRIAIALFGWNPAVQYVGAQMDLEREVACDDWVLAATGLVRPYALCLTKMAETSSWPRRTIPAPGVFATRKHISLRIERLLGAGRNIATNLAFGPTAAAVAIVAALAFAMQLVAPSIAAPVVAAQDTNIAGQTWHPPAPMHLLKMQMPFKTVAHDAAQTKPVNGSAQKPPTVVYIQNTRVNTSGTHVTTPATHVDIPATHVDVPGTHVDVPGGQVDVPGASVDVPAMDVKVPAAPPAMPPRTVAQASTIRNCEGCDMKGVNWAGRDMRGVNYTGADLSHSNLAGTNFADGNFSGVDFSNSNLQGASFRNAKLVGCNFDNANLHDVDFSGAKLSGCQFNHAEMSSSEIRAILNTCSGCEFSHANLSGLDLSNVRTSGLDLSYANLAGANLSGAQFTGTDFNGAILKGANLNGAVFSGCDFSKVDLTQVDLSKARFVGTDLSGQPKQQ